MRFTSRRSWVSVAGAVFLLLLGVAATALAQTSTITGRVMAKESNQPLTDVRVVIVTSNNFAITGIDGRYTLRNVPSGGIDLRVLRVGYTEQKKRVTLTPGQSEVVDFVMEQAIVQLQDVVVTATGNQRRVELGNSVATLDVNKAVANAPIKNFGDLMAAKAPGVQILPSNMTGGGSRVRIRGASSFSLSNDPIYVIDGIRMTSGNGSAIGVGGTTPNRVNDINPEEIENIEIVKGPSAATLYGTDAANGVIVITTKKGRAGAARWTVFADHGRIEDKNDYPGTYAILGHLPATPTVARKCVLTEIGLGTCIKDSTSSLNIFSDPDLTMLKPGLRDNEGVQVQGGTDAIRYFASADVQKETGVFGLPAFNTRRFDSLKVPIEDSWSRPNTLGQASFRSNLNVAISPQLDVAISAGFVKLDQRLPQVDNNVNSFWYNGMTGPGWKGAGPGYTGIGSLGQPLMGYGGFTPGEIFQRLTTQGVQRFIGGTNANWRPYGWLQLGADMGIDLTDRDDFGLQKFAQGPDFSTQRLGTATDARQNIRNFTWNMRGTATNNPTSWLNLKSTFGWQYVNFRSDGNSANGTQLPPGASTPGQGTTPNVGTNTTMQKTLGLFIEEAASIRDRLFVTAAVRSDQNSAFGTNFQRVYYPKGSISWIISDEDFFPRISWLDQVRFRSSVGAAGVQPGPTDALKTFATTSTSINGADVSGLRSNALGNPDIKPERSVEYEGGLDLRLLKSRLNLEITYYNKYNHDALFNQTIAPSTGASAGSVRRNLGGTNNTGVEVLVNAQVIDMRAVGWDMTLAASHNGNKLVALGLTASGDTLPSINPRSTVQQRSGYPLNGYWSRAFTYNDANGDGIIVPSEVTVDTLSGDKGWRLIGYSQPRDEVSLTNGFEFLNRKLRISVLADYKGGSNLFNNEEGFLCQQTTSCPYTSSFSASLYNQARTVAERNLGTLNTQYGFAEPLRFWRLREVSATYTFPDRWAEKFLKARGGSVNFSVRNIKVWTKYTGVDPEANYGQGDTQQTLLTAGPPRYFQFRLNLRY